MFGSVMLMHNHDQPSVRILGIEAHEDLSTNAFLQESLAGYPFGFVAARLLPQIKSMAGADKMHAYPRPLLPDLLNKIQAQHVKEPKRTMLLIASGDPMWFGIGATLVRQRPHWKIEAHPARASFQLASARLKWPLQDTHCLSLHGRPIRRLLSHLIPQGRYLILGQDAHTPQNLCRMLMEFDREGAHKSMLTVISHLGGNEETFLENNLPAWCNTRVDPFHIMALTWHGKKQAFHGDIGLTRDDHDGNITKEPFRSLAIQALAPYPGAVLWDIGAGCGGISLAWCRYGGRVVCVEPRLDRYQFLKKNLSQQGLDDRATLVTKRAPSVFKQDTIFQESPQAIFIGGGLSSAQGGDLLHACVKHITSEGRLVAHAITPISESKLIQAHHRFGGRLHRFAWQETEMSGANLDLWQPQKTMTQWVLG